jgi:hypothetical protein
MRVSPTASAPRMSARSATYDDDSNLTRDAISTIRSNGSTATESDSYSYVSEDAATNPFDGADGSYQNG